MTGNRVNNHGFALKAYLLLSTITAPLLRVVINQRLKKGKESPQRYQEKLGVASQQRPPSPLIWLHGVGLGEVLALRGLILSLIHCRPDLTILVTSSTRTSAEVFTKHITAQTIHQLLPLDAKPFVNKFLDHWQPDISVWAEQDLWPLLVTETHRRHIPLMLVNARMNEKAYKSRRRLKSLYRDLYSKFDAIVAQDTSTADHMRKLGGTVTVGCSLKSVAIPLDDDSAKRTEFEHSIRGRKSWLLATSHYEDESVAIAAHAEMLRSQPDLLLVIAPRLINRTEEIADQCRALNLSFCIRSSNEEPSKNVYIADTFGEMGLWYRTAYAAFIGGSMGPVQGHNPWEAAVLNCPIIHGPNTDNFRNDYFALHEANAAIAINTREELVITLQNQALLTLSKSHAKSLTDSNNQALESLAQEILTMLPTMKTNA